MIRKMWEGFLDWFRAQERAARFQKMYEETRVQLEDLQIRYEYLKQRHARLERDYAREKHYVYDFAFLQWDIEQGKYIPVSGIHCHSCGGALVEDANFCHECGQKRGQLPVLPQKDLTVRKEIRV